MMQTVFFWVADYKMSKDQMSSLTQVLWYLHTHKINDSLKYHYITMKIKILLQQITKREKYYLCSFVF